MVSFSSLRPFGPNHDAPRRCIYFFAELMKLGVALAWCFKAYRENDREVVKHFSVDRSDFLQYAVPGFVFFAQNNLSFWRSST